MGIGSNVDALKQSGFVNGIKKAGKILNPVSSFKEGATMAVSNSAKRKIAEAKDELDMFAKNAKKPLEKANSNVVKKFSKVKVNGAKQGSAAWGTTEGIGAYRQSLEDKIDQLQEAVDSLADGSNTLLGNRNNLSPGDYALGALGALKGYYGPSGKTAGELALRYGATAGIVGAGMIGARELSGGSLTRNSDGSKDIVGIPFV